MKKIKVLLFSLFVGLLSVNIFGQGKNDPPPPYNPYEPPQWIRDIERARVKMDERHGRGRDGMIIQPPATRNNPPPLTESQEERFREQQKTYFETLRRLQAPAIYFKTYESFLQNDNSGLARLFVDRNCDQGKTVSVEELERCGDFIPVKGGGSYYSFRTKKNFFGKDGWDIHFINEQFKVGNDSTETVVARLGDVKLEDVKLDSKAFSFLKKYKPKGTIAEIKEQNKVLERGIEANDFVYSNIAAAELNTTYVLRSIAYLREGDNPPFVDTTGRVNRIFGPERGVDVYVAFRVVGREQDGSLIVLWKELKIDVPRKVLK